MLLTDLMEFDDILQDGAGFNALPDGENSPSGGDFS